MMGACEKPTINRTILKVTMIGVLSIKSILLAIKKSLKNNICVYSTLIAAVQEGIVISKILH
jgi:hypothetical protein